jgi:hypothetical protein
VKVPLVSITLGAMRLPARLAGLGHLQQFLERGLSTIRKLDIRMRSSPPSSGAHRP